MMISTQRHSAHPAIEVFNAERIFSKSGGLLGETRKLRAVDGVSFNVDFGDVLGIVGESGCGKSTLARLILGLLPVTGGEIRVDGRDLGQLDRKERARLIQPIFQDPFSSLNPTQRIRDIVELPLKAQGPIGSAERNRRVGEMLERVGLPGDMGDRFPAQLSGGQRQRVAIARALVLKPRIVVCDEPTSALDVSVQAQVLNLLADLRRDLGLTLIFISHNLAVVEHIASHVAVMYLGRMVEHAPTDQLFRAPAHPYTKALLESVLTPEPGLGLPDVKLGDSYPDPSNVPPGCRFHPRCPSAFAPCASQHPAVTRLVDRTIECLLFEGQQKACPAAATVTAG
ncbi:MAG: oligopeptide/dipeptide ABC transporter ATP-binding protein [Mesorhizobium sp.]